MPLFYHILCIFTISIIASPIVLWVTKKVLIFFNLFDRPHLYKNESGRKPVPYGAGIAVFLLLVLLSPALFVFANFSPLLEKRLIIVLILGGIISLISFVDDLDTIGKSPIKIPPIARLIMQITVGAIIGLTSIKISYISHIFGGIMNLDNWFSTFVFGEWTMTIYWIPIVVTIVWYVIVFNAINFSDGIPGLTGGFSLISFIILAGLAMKLYTTDTSLASQENSRFLLFLLAIIIPITFFLTRADIARHIIMGDSGTIMLGFLIATLAIIAGGKIATAISVLGIYLIDFIYVVASRVFNGKNPMQGDQTSHLHFRLMEIGLSKRQIRFVVYILSSIFGLSAIFLTTTGKILLFVLIAVITIFLTEILNKIKKR